MSTVNEHGSGCLTGKVDLRDYKVCAANIANVLYPVKFQLDNLPNVKDQGHVNSCVAHVASEILEYYSNNKTKLSTNFIYGIQNYLFGTEHQGMYLSDACKIVKQFGDMTLQDCPGNKEVPFCYSIAENALKDEIKKTSAYYYRIQSYYSCGTLEDIKYALMTYGPVLGAISMYEQYVVDSNNILVQNKQSRNVGGHAILIYGWNKDGWLCQNSWGEDFADCGRMVVPFDDIIEAKVLIDYINDGDPALVSPKMNCILDFICKILNTLINFIKKLQYDNTSQ